MKSEIDPATALAESSGTFQRLFGKAAVATCLVSPQGHFIETNATVSKLLRRPREELIGMRVDEVTDPRDIDLCRTMLDLALQGKLDQLLFRKRCLDSSNRVVPVLFSGSLVRDDEGRPLFFLSQVQDLSDTYRMARRVRSTDAKYQQLVERMPAVAYSAEPEAGNAGGQWHYVSPQIESLLGYSPAEWRGDPALWRRSVHPDDLERVLAEEHESLDRGRPLRSEYRMFTRDRRQIWVLDEATVVSQQGDAATVQGFLLDITSSKQVEAQKAAIVQLGESALRRVAFGDLMEEAVTLLADNLGVEYTKVLRLEHGGEELRLLAGVGWNEGVVGKKTLPTGTESQAGHTLTANEPVIVEDLASEERFTGPELLFDHGVVSGMSVIIQGAGAPFGVLGAHTTARRRFGPADVAFLQSVANILASEHARVESEAETRRQALYDSLTGLPNRTYFLGRLSQLLSRPNRSGQVALLLIDLDGFKVTNDSFGSDCGDHVLVECATRLASLSRDGDTLARVGGDVFALILEYSGQESAIDRAEQIISTVRQPFTVDATTLEPAASVGITLTNGAQRPAEMVLGDAEAAVKRAKERGGDRYEFFDQRRQRELMAMLETERELRNALAEDQLVVHYQPIVELPGERLRAVEALVRWQHPRRGLIGPDAFIPLAEDRGLIAQIGRRVRQIAFTQLRRWTDDGIIGGDVRLCLNLSARELAEAHLFGEISRSLRESSIRPEQLAFELTESALSQNFALATAVLGDLKELGAHIALDDFGTGYSSLSYLRRFDIDVLKLDRSFIQEIDANGADRSIVNAVVQMAAALNIDLVAEGVERPEQARQLVTAGCRYAQGFLFARPMPASELAASLR